MRLSLPSHPEPASHVLWLTILHCTSFGKVRWRAQVSGQNGDEQGHEMPPKENPVPALPDRKTLTQVNVRLPSAEDIENSAVTAAALWSLLYIFYPRLFITCYNSELLITLFQSLQLFAVFSELYLFQNSQVPISRTLKIRTNVSSLQIRIEMAACLFGQILGKLCFAEQWVLWLSY